MTETAPVPPPPGRPAPARTASTPVPSAEPAAAPEPPRTALGRLGRGLGHLTAGVPLAVVAFVVAVIGFALGVATLVVGIGLPVLAATLRAARALAAVEREATERALGRAMPPHHYRPGGRMLAPLADPQCWRDLLHAVVGFPLRLATGIVALAWAAAGVAGAVAVLWQWAVPAGDFNGLLDLVTGIDSAAGEVAVTTVGGLLLLATLPLVVRGATGARAVVARLLLTNPVAALQARADRLETSRRAAVAAETSTLRRVERDLHDGPQQRLVRLDMDIEAALRRLDDDPEQARPLLAGALEQNREALAELRALARGIAPPVLADRGLGAALTAAAGRSPVPVDLRLDLPDTLPPAVRDTAYFVVTEALTNVAKHSAATACTVEVRAAGAALHVRVADDGRGGARPGAGSGLAGLADRVAAAGGTFAVASPPGGPTVLTATIPRDA